MQTSVDSYLNIGLPGQIADNCERDIISRVNGSMMLSEITITAANLATTATINGTAVTVNSGAATLTTIELAALLLAAINLADLGVTASAGSTTSKVYVRADVHGTAFTAVGTTNCSVAAIVANEETIDFGKVVTEDTWTGLDNTAHLPLAAADITDAKLCLGITARVLNTENGYNGAANSGYAAYSSMSIMRRGRIYVVSESAFVKGHSVYARYTVNGTLTLGSIRGDDDSSKAAIIPSARFVTSGSANGIALVELNLP